MTGAELMELEDLDGSFLERRLEFICRFSSLSFCSAIKSSNGDGSADEWRTVGPPSMTNVGPDDPKASDDLSAPLPPVPFVAI